MQFETEYSTTSPVKIILNNAYTIVGGTGTSLITKTGKILKQLGNTYVELNSTESILKTALYADIFLDVRGVLKDCRYKYNSNKYFHKTPNIRNFDGYLFIINDNNIF